MKRLTNDCPTVLKYCTYIHTHYMYLVLHMKIQSQSYRSYIGIVLCKEVVAYGTYGVCNQGVLYVCIFVCIIVHHMHMTINFIVVIFRALPMRANMTIINNNTSRTSRISIIHLKIFRKVLKDEKELRTITAKKKSSILLHSLSVTIQVIIHTCVFQSSSMCQWRRTAEEHESLEHGSDDVWSQQLLQQTWQPKAVPKIY